MGATSRTKGNAGEREIAALIRDLTGWDVRRRVRQHDGDSDLMGVPGWSVEVKRHARALRGDIAASFSATAREREQIAGLAQEAALTMRKPQCVREHPELLEAPAAARTRVESPPRAHFSPEENDDEFDFPNYAMPLTLRQATEPAAPPSTAGAPAVDDASDARALLDRLTAAGLNVAAEDGRLLIRPAAKFTDALRVEVVAAKPELLTLLSAKTGESEHGCTNDRSAEVSRVKQGLSEAVVPTAEINPIEDAEPLLADRQERALQRQRERRARRSRIDYYPSADASKVIDSLRHRSVGGDASSIIDRALIEWGASGITSGPKRPEARRCCDAQEARKHSS